MGSKKWTSDQKEAFSVSGKNILVSAAAGSGKTAVLVERIIRMITDDTRNIDVDRLVVVTFTRAAAAEMRQRIRDALERVLEAEPDNDRVLRQTALLNHAQITTIDSFCLNILHNHFAETDIDPGFRTADQGEIKMLAADVMEQMLEDYYEEGSPQFLEFVDAYGQGRDDSAITELIVKTYSNAISNPWPEEWLADCLQFYETDSMQELEKSDAVRRYVQYLHHIFQDYEEIYLDILNEIRIQENGLEKCIPTIQEEHEAILYVLQQTTYEGMYQAIRRITFGRLSSVRSGDLEYKEYIKNVRNGYKKMVRSQLQEKAFAMTPSKTLELLQKSRQSAQMLVQLTEDYIHRLQEEKKKRNLIEFNDMEHLALDILVKRQNKESVYTDTADTLSAYYEEILIDEYQDSNRLQEEILMAVSKGRKDPSHGNTYMVGDVKQSIYGFRQACPSIFIGKYNQYQKGVQADNQKILLQVNFRSREKVLEGINEIFKHAMNPDYGEIAYGKEEQLNPGMAYPKAEEGVDFGGTEGQTEIWMIENGEADRMEIEAQAAAKRIQELMDPARQYQVYDAHSASYRPIRYSDIVILTRTNQGWADVFINELMNQGIPAYAESSAGYFAVQEIRTLLQMLAVVDNPLQDIPMAAVMLSYFGKFSTQELAEIRIRNKNRFLFQLLREETDKENADQKITEFVKKIDIFREKAAYLPINDLLWEIIYETGYYAYVGNMPAGSRRQANLDALLNKAAAFSSTSYSGLFQFLRYLDKLQQFDVDFGEAFSVNENDDLVRIMTIHKSKGLEFPVVILVGIAKKFNQKDAAGSVLVHRDLGIGMDAVFLEDNIQIPTFYKNLIAERMKQDVTNEELRLLYVAMTRAREKLILIGSTKDAERSVKKWTDEAGTLFRRYKMSFQELESAACYADVLIPAALQADQSAKKLFLTMGLKGVTEATLGGIMRQTLEESRQATDDGVTEGTARTEKESRTEQAEQDLTDRTASKPADRESKELAEAEELLQIPYGYPQDITRKPKVTVTELKKQQYEAALEEEQQEEESRADFLVQAARTEAEETAGTTGYVPGFISGKEQQLRGNERGTAYHRVMECLDLCGADSVERIREEMQQMVQQEKLSQLQYESVNPADIYAFCQSSIGKRAVAAQREGRLHREQPFMFGVPFEEGGEDLQLVQGVIDLFLEEKGSFVILDYKTDAIPPGQDAAQVLTGRYHIQLDYYAKALEQITGEKVSETILYSFHANQEIPVKGK